MNLETLPVLSLAAPSGNLAQELGDSFQHFGFALVSDHGLDPALIARGWDLTRAFFALPEAEKRRWHVAGGGGQRGYTPFGTEIAKGAAVHDLKEFWHVGREGASDPAMPANVWPDAPSGFRETFAALYAGFDRIGARILAHIAVWLGLEADWFDPAIAGGNSILRMLHYPPIPGDTGGAIRAGAHEDINLITLLVGASAAGLEVKSRSGEWVPFTAEADTIVVNIGDMLQRLTNHVYPSTTHRVVNPPGEAARIWNAEVDRQNLGSGWYWKEQP